jgi:antagonist of KipI
MWRPIALEAGSEVRIARVLRGARAYVAMAGGIDVPMVLGSRSTDLSSGFGGWQGRALRAGDRLSLLHASAPVWRLKERLLDGQTAWRAAPWWVGPVEDLGGAVAMLHLLPGADLAALDPRVLRALRDGVWTVSPDSDRMGLRFDGPPVPRTPTHEQISAAVLPGTVQLPPDGLPIVLGVDAQTVGGYPRVGQVIRADLGRAMQLRPGERVRPVLITADAANAAWLARQRNLSRMSQALSARWTKV